ncbi:Uncharacterised protein [Mycobacterium tuberculosis]|nr:Uncharacterised protein [Mycobacterium tuberculosis]
MPITRIGICAPRSATKSKPPAPISGSKLREQNSRILGSSALTLRGVNIRDNNLRWMSWIGGSSKMTVPGGMSILALMISRIAPLAELKV